MADPDHRSEKVGKVSDSAYSNSYNSQTTRSHSCNSAVCRQSDSRSSGSSGYGGNPSSGSSGASGSHKKKKEVETKNDIPDLELEVVVEDTQEQKPTDLSNVNITSVPVSDDQFSCEEKASNIKEDDINIHLPQSNKQEHFTCVVAMQTGMIIYSTTTLCNALGYPQEMWVGRSFIDFVNPRDQAMFASQVSNMVKASMSMTKESQSQTRVSIHCRLRQYNGLASSGFGIKTRSVAYLPFKLVLSFYAGKRENELDISEKNKENILGIGHDKEAFENFKGAYIVVQATSIVTSFNVPLEILAKGVIFTLRHTVLGVIEHIDAISIPYLGYMPHDLVGKCAIKMYHPEDLHFLRRVYEMVIKVGQAPKTSFRIQTQNGDYVRVETEFTCFVNPWSKKMEYVTAHHEVIQGPCEVDVFGQPDPERSLMAIRKVRVNAEIMRDQILRTMSECLTKLAEMAKQQMSRKCQKISIMMDKFKANPGQELRPEYLENEPGVSEKDYEMLGGVSPHHDFYDSNSASTDTSPSYNQMNYKENLQRFFDSEPITHTGLSPQLQISTNNNTFNLDRIDNVVGMEWDDDDDIFISSYSSDNDDKICQRLTQAALKKHNQEMEVALYKQHQDSRYQTGKRMLSRQRLEHLARCNIFHDNNTQTFVKPKQLVMENDKNLTIDNTEVSNNSNRDRSHSSKHPCKREYLPSAKRNESAKKREFRREMKEGKHGIKRDMTFACIGEKGGPHKQVKPASSDDVRYSDDNHAMAFNAPLYHLWPEQINGFPPPMVSGSPQTDDPAAHLWSEQMNRFPPPPPIGSALTQTNDQANVLWSEQINMLPTPMISGSPQINSHDNVWSEQSTGLQTPMMSGSPQINCQANVGSEQMNGFPPPVVSGSPQTNGSAHVWPLQMNHQNNMSASLQASGQAHGLYQMYYLRDPVGVQTTNSPNIVPMMLYSNVYGQPIVYAPMNPSLQYQIGKNNNHSFGKVTTNGTRNKGGRVNNSSWNHLHNNEPMSSSDQDNNRTEGETSSSFYSSFLKMDSSGEEQGKSSSDKDSVSRNRSKCMKWVQGQVNRINSEDSNSGLVNKNNSHYYTRKDKLIEPPWMKDVVPSDELFYRYQLPKVNGKEEFEKAKQFLDNVQQSVEVNDQLGQLYVDLHLQGVTSKLTLEDGITSSGSSGEDSGPGGVSKRKRKPYGQMAMLFEEDAPFPPQEEIDMKHHYIPVRPLVPSCSRDNKLVIKKVPKFDNLETFYKNVDRNESIEAVIRDQKSITDNEAIFISVLSSNKEDQQLTVQNVRHTGKSVFPHTEVSYQEKMPTFRPFNDLKPKAQDAENEESHTSVAITKSSR